ncbi:hypothetical protein ACLI4Z_16450 [Natrialbaceae archaeon A-arb3/5]
MASNTVDKIDMVALWVYSLMATMVFGIWTFALDVFGGYDFSEPFASYGGTEIGIPLSVTTLAFLWILWTNEFDGSNYSNMERWTIIAVLALPVVYEFIPAAGNLIAYNEYVLVLAAGICTFGAVWISYTE